MLGKEQLAHLADLDRQIEKLQKCETLSEEQVRGRKAGRGPRRAERPCRA
jgi:hypothetical protein